MSRVTFTFPMLGVNGAAPLSAMPEGACPDLLNLFPVAQSGQVSSRRMVGAKRPGLTHAADQTDTSHRSGYGVFLWETIYKPTSTTQDPITIMVMCNSNAGIELSRVTANTLATFEASFNVAGTDAVSLLRPQFAQLGTKLFILGPTKTNGSNAGKACGCYLNSLQNVNAMPTSSTEWVVETYVAGADLCCTYRASVVIAATRGTIFRVSAIGDGTNFTPTGDDDGAYTGNSSGKAGIPGDGIIAMVPFGDEYLIFGCVSSIWKLSGDPRSGGRVSRITDRVGFLNKSAWCYDPQGTLWFIGSDYGLYRMPRGGTEFVEVLQGRADFMLRDVLQAVSGRTVYLLYNTHLSAVMVMITPSTPGTANALSSFAYKPALDGIYPIRFGNSSANYATHNCGIGTDWGDLFFGFYVSGVSNTTTPLRRMSPVTPVQTDVADTTQATPINFQCRIRFAAVEPGQGHEWTATKLVAIGSQGSTTASWYWVTAASADEVQRVTYTSGYAATGTIFASGSGLQQPIGLRQTASAHQLCIDQTGTGDLRFGSFTVTFVKAGKERYGA